MGLIAIGIWYAHETVENSEPGLKGNARSSFVNSMVASCTEKQNKAAEAEGKSIPVAITSQYCNCYAASMADKLSNNDLIKYDNTGTIPVEFLLIANAASKACLKAAAKQIQ